MMTVRIFSCHLHLVLVTKPQVMNPVIINKPQITMENVYNRPAVSIILPFEPKMMAKATLGVLLKKATEAVKAQLNEYPEELTELIMGKVNRLVTNLNYNTHKKSVAIFISPVMEKVLYMDMPVNEKVMVGDDFDIREVVYTKKDPQQYLVLVLSGKASRLYLGNCLSLCKIISSVPESVSQFVNDIPEKVGNFSDTSARREIVMDKFLHHIDQELGIMLHAYRLPLFVLGSEKVVGHFKSLTHHNKSVVEYVQGNFIDNSPAELSAAIKPYLDEWEKVIARNVLNRLDEAADKKKLATGIRDVWRKAMNRSGRLLVMEKGYMCGSQRSDLKQPVYMTAKPYNKFSIVKNAVDDIIQAVLESGGNVEFVENGLLEQYDHIALVQYY